MIWHFQFSGTSVDKTSLPKKVCALPTKVIQNTTVVETLGLIPVQANEISACTGEIEEESPSLYCTTTHLAAALFKNNMLRKP